MQELTPESVLEQQTPAQEAEAQAAEEARLPEDLPEAAQPDEQPQADTSEKAEEAEPAQPADEPQADAQPQPVTVVDIRFRNNAKSYFFDPDGMTLTAGTHVIIDTARGDEFGTCASGCHEVSQRELVLPLRKVLRVATAQDERINADNQE